MSVKEGSRGASDVVHLYLELPRREIAYLKFIIEAYEGVAVVRTVERRGATIVLLFPADQEAEVRSILTSVRGQIPWREVPPPAGLADDWLERELATLGGDGED